MCVCVCVCACVGCVHVWVWVWGKGVVIVAPYQIAESFTCLVTLPFASHAVMLWFSHVNPLENNNIHSSAAEQPRGMCT